MAKNNLNVIIIGAGIMGLSSAWALSRNGHRVTIFEQNTIPNPLGSSVDQHRVIRHAYGAHEGYTMMVDDAFSAWQQLWTDLGQSFYTETGTLMVDRSGASFAADSERVFQKLNISHQVIERSELAEKYDLLEFSGATKILYIAAGGLLSAEKIVAALADYLVKNSDVQIQTGKTVTAIDARKVAVTLDDDSTQSADKIVIAAGPWVNRLLPYYKTRVTPSRQVVVYVQPPPETTKTWNQMPTVIDIAGSQQHPEICYIIPPREHIPVAMKIGTHSFTLSGDPDKDRIALETEIDEVLQTSRFILKRSADYRAIEAKTCFYTVEEQNEQFIVEPVTDDIWVMTGFSGHGFKFGALMGLAMAESLSGEIAADILTKWASGQFLFNWRAYLQANPPTRLV